jgi:hypothetical protein
MKIILLLAAVLTCAGCAFNRPHLTETIISPDGTKTVRELIVPSWVLWPATSSLEKQRVSLGKTFSVGTSGLEQESGGTNVVEALRAIDSILGKIR